jgi:outer membrane immunogenic protein
MSWTKVAVFGLLAFCGVAHCANADEYRPRRAARAAAPAPTTNWTGFQTGATGGNSSLAQNFAEPGAFLCPGSFGGPFGGVAAAPCAQTPFGFSGGTASSFTAGGFLGYRMQFGSLVVGVEGDAAWKRAQTSSIQTDMTALGVTEKFTGSLQQGWDGSLRGRLGILVTPSLLAYGTAGGAIGDVSGSFSYNASGPPLAGVAVGLAAPSVAGAGSWSDTRLGYTAGGGLEAALGGGLKARLEYRYTDFGHISQNIPLTSLNCVAAAGCTSGTNSHIDTNAAFQTVKIGIGIDF